MSVMLKRQQLPEIIQIMEKYLIFEEIIIIIFVPMPYMCGRLRLIKLFK